MSRQRDELGIWLAALGFAAEVPFPGLSGTRRWRWDYAIDRRAEGGPAVAVEYQGVMHRQASHQSVTGAVRDHAKISEGQLCGYTVIQCNAKSVEDGTCLTYVERAMGRAA